MAKIDEIKMLRLGQRDENLARSLAFDCSDWLEQYPEASIHILFRRPGESAIVPMSTTLEGTTLTWLIHDYEVGKTGIGNAEFRAVDTAGLRRKSRIIPCSIEETLLGDDETVLYTQDQVDETLAHISEAAQAALAAKASEEAAALSTQEAEESAASAGTAADVAVSAKDAAQAAQTAAETAQHQAEAAQSGVYADAEAAEQAKVAAQAAQASAQGAASQASADRTAAESARADAEAAATHAEAVVEGIDQAGADQVAAVNAAGQAQVTAVNQAGTTQVGNVNTAGTTQVNAVQAKGTQVINSIPADYSALTSEVTGLKSALKKLFDLALTNSTAIADNTDYDNLSTPGTYYAGNSAVASATNCPTAQAHKMVVLYTVNAFGVYQIIFDQNSTIYYRNYGAGQFRAWHRIGDATAESVQELSDALENQIFLLNNLKADKRISVTGSVGTQETGATGLDGSVMSADSHIEITVSQGEIYYITGWAYNSNLPLYTVKDADGNVISNGTTEDGYHTNVQALMPENASTLYVRGRRIGSGREPYIYSTYCPYVIESTGDTTDRTAEIQAALTAYGYVKLGTGTFIVKMLNMPQNSMLEGSGDSTILKYNDNETNAIIIRLNTDMTVQSPSILSIKNLKMDGGLTARPASYAGRNGRIAISHHARNTLLRLENVTITGFSSDGINVEYVGLEEGYSIQMLNCMVKWCGCGLNMDAKAEFCNVTNCLFHFNYVGCNNYGGNNKYTNCGFENNVIGFQLDRSTTYADANVSYLNNGHASAVGCSFNHNTNPIKVDLYYNGYTFSGCMIYTGTVLITNQGKGIMFIGCQFTGGTGQTIDIRRNYLTVFNGCMFFNVPDSSHVILPETHNLIKTINCFALETGDAVDF